jgi:hypothetical protein
VPDPLLDALAQAPSGVPPDARPVLAWTLADHLACVLGASPPAGHDPSAFDADGVSGTASALALRASLGDRDDVDWQVLTHPGSVVWPTVLATAAYAGCDGPSVARAAFLGYRAVATMAHRLGSAHRATWHVTATAGGFGAAASAGAVLGLEPERQAVAFAHTAAATGGLGQAALERRGAAAFNRAAAAARGIQAVRAVAYGAVPVDAPLDGERALLALLGGEAAPDGTEPEVADGTDTVGPRVYPVSGFGQGAVAATAGLRRAHPDDVLEELVVEVAEPAARLMDGSAGDRWWSLADAAAAAWAGGDPFSLAPTQAAQALAERVRVVPGDLPPGAARVCAVTDRGHHQTEAGPPGPGPELDRKWATMLAAAGRSEDPVALAEWILADGVTPDHLELLLRAATDERQP